MKFLTKIGTLSQTDSLESSSNLINKAYSYITDTPTDQIISTGLENAINLGLKILAAALIYIIGIWIVKKIRNILRKTLNKKSFDPSVSSFLLSLSSFTLYILLIITTISALGVDTTSIVAILAGSGLAIGLALSGTLQNFAGGVMILLFKPFKVGDYIEAQGESGTVTSIEITATHISTPDNKIIILPNGVLSNNVITNFSSSGVRRCDWKVGVAYGSDITKAKELILNIIKENKSVLNTPFEPFVAIDTMGDSSVILVARAWVGTDGYWDLFYDINEKIYNTLPANNISFPFPQLDVHIKKD